VANLSKSMRKLKDDIATVKYKLRVLECRLGELTYRCTHHIVECGSSAKCVVCEQDFGWWCPDNPSHICDYEQPDGRYDSDQCVHCGQPNERK